MNHLINSLLNFLKQPLVIGILAVLSIAFMFGGFNWYYSRKYDKERIEYQKKEDSWNVERTTMIANAEAKEKKIAELESQNVAFRTAAEQGKKVDDALAAKIDQVSKEAADEMDATDLPADCWVRADRTCAKLRALKPPIIVDCDEYKRKVCSR